MASQIYRMDDRPDAASKAAIRCNRAEAEAWNTPERGFGVFRTVNDFGTDPRRKEFLKRINAWAIDIDDGSKAEQHAKLQVSPLVPSLIVETKRGYQAYWCARDGQAEHWNAIVLERLVAHFGADRNARDLCRILRCPGFLHLKDPADPFPVQIVWQHNVSYHERQMALAWPWRCATPDRVAEVRATVQAAKSHGSAPDAPTGHAFWDAVANLNCLEALERLSGTGYVNGERFTFRRMSNGNLNIFCDGRGTSCWVDASGKIGSLDKGGPFISHWLRWYGNDWPTTIRALKDTFPELADADARDRDAWIAAKRAARRAA
jgi:hypothetical protein